jgi:hypothetical protein
MFRYIFANQRYAGFFLFPILSVVLFAAGGWLAARLLTAFLGLGGMSAAARPALSSAVRRPRLAAAARTRTQRPGKHLAVRASELVVKPDFQILRRYRRPLLLRLEHTHRPTLEDYVHRATRVGSSRSLNMRIGISIHW